MLFGKGGCCFCYQGTGKQRRTNLSLLRIANQAVQKPLRLDPQAARRIAASMMVALGKQILLSQLPNVLPGILSRALGDPSSGNRSGISPAKNTKVQNTKPTPAERPADGPGDRNQDIPEKRIEEVLFHSFPIGRTTTIGFFDGFWTGSWAGITESAALLTKAQLYNNSGNAIGAVQAITRIPVSKITFVV